MQPFPALDFDADAIREIVIRRPHPQGRKSRRRRPSRSAYRTLCEDSLQSESRTWQCAFYPARRSRSKRKLSMSAFSHFSQTLKSGSVPADQHRKAKCSSRCAGVSRRGDRAAHPAMRGPARDRAAVAGFSAPCERSGAAKGRFARQIIGLLTIELARCALLATPSLSERSRSAASQVGSRSRRRDRRFRASCRRLRVPRFGFGIRITRIDEYGECGCGRELGEDLHPLRRQHVNE
jgi:hypothetical protein